MAKIVFAGIAGAVALAALGLLVPTEPQPGGGRSLEGWWLAQVVFACALGMALTALRARRAALLAAFFLVGTAGQLALTSPLWLQFIEMRPDALLEWPRALAVSAVVLQTLVVLGALRDARRSLVAAVGQLCGKRTVLVLSVVLLLTGAHVSVFIGGFPELFFIVGYAAQLLAAAGFAVLNLTHLWLLARALPAPALERLQAAAHEHFSFPGDGPGSRPQDHLVPWCLATLSFAVAVVIAVFVFERMPHVQDEAAFLFQARQLASLEVSSPAPAELDAHSYYLIDSYDGRWHATTKPGWPAVLAVGVALGVPWLVNPLLGAITVLLLHALALQLTRDRGTAHLVAALTATSPWFLFLAGSMMGHTLPLLMTVLGYLWIARALESDRWALALAAGLVFGFGVLIRPVDGLVVGALAGLWLLLDKGIRLRLLIPFAAGCVAATLPILPYNRAVTGHALTDPMQKYLDRIWSPGANRLGFGTDIGPPSGWGSLDLRPGHDLFEVLINSNQNLYNIHFELLGWSYISILPLVAHLCWSRWNQLDRRLLAFTVVLIAALSVYWFSGGPDFGARYWFLAFIPIILWSARGLITSRDRLARISKDPLIGARIAAVTVLLVALSLAVFCTWRSVGRYVEYRGVHADYRRLLESGALDRALVLVETPADGESELESALLLNHPRLPADRPVFVRADGDLEALRAAYPDRPVLTVRGRTEPGTRVELQRPRATGE